MTPPPAQQQQQQQQPTPTTVVPAQLGFLAIFNPSLGTTDATIDDQIVYYASVSAQHPGAPPRRRHRGNRARPTEGISPEERNERLRQIGLAQGMVEFSRGFADGNPVDTIETEKSRVVLRELEAGWWILASIDLTKLPLPPRLGAAAKDDTSENVEYSSREIKSAALLVQDLLRAHSIFLLHHAASLSALFVRSNRSRFVAILSRYWDLFLSTWNVMLHGNAACAIFGGIKIAASGQLGVGVGEEERGSGEREVLEGFVGRVEGLVDLVVSKFGHEEVDNISEQGKSLESADSRWLGTGEEPGAEDGAVFLGVGALSKKSLRSLTHWMEDLYTWGEGAYGVKESPTATRVKAKRQRVKVERSKDESAAPSAAPQSAVTGSPAPEQAPLAEQNPQPDGDPAGDDGGTSKLMNYLKLGYGTHWSLGGSESSNPGPEDGVSAKERPALQARGTSRQSVSDSTGHYLIGLQGDVEEDSSESPDSDPEELDSRTLVRTLTVELENEWRDRPEVEFSRDLGSGDHELSAAKPGRNGTRHSILTFDSQDRNKTKRMRVVVYVSKPFIYTFLFQNQTDSLAWDSLYKSLHFQLEPLRKPLALSTSYRPDKPDSGGTASHIFDLIWDPRSLTVHSTIPSIPDPSSLIRPDAKRQDTWSRAEALNTHMQILQTYAGTREDQSEMERTCKTSRGWWVVWTRLMEAKDSTTSSAGSRPPLPTEDSQDSAASNDTAESGPSTYPTSFDAPSASPAPNESNSTINKKRRQKKPKVDKEIFLIRRAGETASRMRSLSQIKESKEGWADGASRLAQGIGVDTRKYIESLLSLAQ